MQHNFGYEGVNKIDFLVLILVFWSGDSINCLPLNAYTCLCVRSENKGCCAPRTLCWLPSNGDGVRVFFKRIECDAALCVSGQRSYFYII